MILFHWTSISYSILSNELYLRTNGILLSGVFTCPDFGETTALQADRKLMRAERNLSKVEAFLNPLDRPADPGSITDEERFMFRKLGLRMKAFLLLGKKPFFL